MTPHAAVIRREGARYYRCITCLALVDPRKKTAHLNAATAAAATFGSDPTHGLEDDE